MDHVADYRACRAELLRARDTAIGHCVELRSAARQICEESKEAVLRAKALCAEVRPAVEQSQRMRRSEERMNVYPKPGAVKVMSLLAACSLPNSDISEKKLQNFFGCGSEGNPRGVIGVELYGDVGLLRSLAVASEVRGRGCGSRLVEEVERHAGQSGVKRLYLLTTTAESFFAGLGYARVDRDCVPAPIKASEEFSGLCPTSATVMAKYLKANL